MRIRRWALNAGIVGLALIIGGIPVVSSSVPVSVGWFGTNQPTPVFAVDAQGLWGVVLLLLGLLTLLWTIAWTVGNNASRPDAD